MARVSSDQVDRARVQTWAQWRRDGKSYDEISALDMLQPSYPTIKKYLEQYGFDGDGMPLNGNGAEPAPVAAPAPAVKMPEGWGPVETKVLSPQKAQSPYAVLAEQLARSASRDWSRVKAPGDNAAGRLREILKKHGLEATARNVGGMRYVYFRLKPGKNGHDE